MIVVAGPRIDPASAGSAARCRGAGLRAGSGPTSRRLRLALVQGGLTTCMELTAAGTPFIYFPLRNHFEQNYHVAHRLDRYGAGRRMAFETSTPPMIAQSMISALRTPVRYEPVEAGGAARTARMLVDLL